MYPQLQPHGSYSANSHQTARDELQLSPHADETQNRVDLSCGSIQGQRHVSVVASICRTSRVSCDWRPSGKNIGGSGVRSWGRESLQPLPGVVLDQMLLWGQST